MYAPHGLPGEVDAAITDVERRTYTRRSCALAAKRPRLVLGSIRRDENGGAEFVRGRQLPAVEAATGTARTMKRLGADPTW